MTSKKTDSDITKTDGDAVKSDGDIELAETGTSEGQTNPLRPTKSMYRAANEKEVERILEAYNNHKAFRLGVHRLQAVARGKQHRREALNMKHERILSFQKKIEAKSPLADMGCFLVFMGLFTLSVMWRVDYDSHYFVQIMRDWVIEEEFPAPDAYIYKNFGDIASEEEFWQYLSGPFVGNMFPEEGAEFFYGTAVIGSIRLRQIRVEDSGEAGCYVPEMMKADFGKECYLELNDNNVAKQKFGNTTALANVRDASDPYHKHFVHAFEYDEEAKAKVTLYEAWRNTYPSKGGYIAVMPSNMTHSKASEFVQQLKSNGWIDGASRAVIIEFAAYNKQTMIFVQTKLFVEFFTTGGAFTYPQFAVCKLATVGTETHLYHQRVALGFRIAVFVFVIGLIIQEFRELAQEGISGYFTSLWNYLDLLNYGVFIVCYPGYSGYSSTNI